MSRHCITPLIATIRALTRNCLALISARPRSDPHMAEQRQRYRVAVGALPDNQRTVFTLHRIEELSIADIALRLDMPPSRVEELLAAALLAIASTLEAPR